jgi:acetolactate synthase-1/2/3 large subunit
VYTGGQVVTHLLEELGADHVFGMCGHTLLGLLDALHESDLNYVSVRHEQMAAHAADAYYRSSHKPAVVITHAGPGLTNTVTGVAAAALDGTPLIVITGDIPSRHIGDEAFQEVAVHADASQIDIFRPLVKRAYRVTGAENLGKTLVRAFNLAYSGRPGPVLISIPMDFLAADAVEELPSLVGPIGDTRRVLGDPEQIRTALELLTSAERPTIYAGGGVIQGSASKQLVKLAEHLGALVATTASGKGAIPEDHPLSVGVAGFKANPVANRVTHEADVLLAVGTRFGEQDASSWHEDFTFSPSTTKIIQVDIDGAELGKVVAIAAGIVGDARAVLTQLNEGLTETPARDIASIPRVSDAGKKLAEWRDAVAADSMSDAVPIWPSRILRELRAALPKDGIVTTDVGWSKNGTAQLFPIYEPGTHLGSGGLGTMGWAVPATLGAKLAHPERAVVGIMGDGAFSTMPQVLMTAVEYGVGAVWLVMNDNAYGAIKTMQTSFYGRDLGTDLSTDSTGAPYRPDYAAGARAMGAEGKRITDPDELGPAIKAALESGRPYVLDVVMQSDVRLDAHGYWDIGELFPPIDTDKD